MANITIVVSAFNRANSLNRCLYSLSKAFYTDKVNLIISIDRGSHNLNVLQLAKSFVWKYGPKKVIYRTRHLGLRKHILTCGDLTQKYGSIILIEDDIYVSPYFYDYATQAKEFYQNDHRIAGISLYSPRYNEIAKLPFEPLHSNYDVFFCQLPSSWGQLWTPNQWKMFRNWYNVKNNLIIGPQNTYIPAYVSRWPETSWKKYFYKYMIEQNKFLVYPYLSFSTNFGDVGTHIKRRLNKFQVPLSYCGLKKYAFCSLDKSSIIYDAFYENIGLCKLFKIKNNLSVDLYGTKSKTIYKRFVLSTQEMNFKIIKMYNMSMRPIEDNVIQNIRGCSIFLYDTSIQQQFPGFLKRISLKNYFYWWNRYSNHASGGTLSKNEYNTCRL